jgi:hypothetical protein
MRHAATSAASEMLVRTLLLVLRGRRWAMVTGSTGRVRAARSGPSDGNGAAGIDLEQVVQRP